MNIYLKHFLNVSLFCQFVLNNSVNTFAQSVKKDSLIAKIDQEYPIKLSVEEKQNLIQKIRNDSDLKAYYDMHQANNQKYLDGNKFKKLKPNITKEEGEKLLKSVKSQKDLEEVMNKIYVDGNSQIELIKKSMEVFEKFIVKYPILQKLPPAESIEIFQAALSPIWRNDFNKK